MRNVAMHITWGVAGAAIGFCVAYYDNLGPALAVGSVVALAIVGLGYLLFLKKS
jgi:hypothetical protein